MDNRAMMALALGALRGADRKTRAALAGARASGPHVKLNDRSSLPRGHAVLLRATVEARTALREAADAAAEAAAHALSMAQVLDEALAVLNHTEAAPLPAPAAHDAPREIAPLSPREREVLALVAEGRTNKAIAEALYVSPNTIKTHVASLLSKLDADTRVDLATMVARHGLR